MLREQGVSIIRLHHGVALLREVAAVARQGWLIPQVTNGLREHGASEHLVVFVHGYFASNGVFEPMARHLAVQGLAPRQLHFNYVPAGSIAGHAVRLRSAIERVYTHGPVHIIAHSLGGLIARYYAQLLGGRMDALVAIATPHQGTRRAEGWPLGLARELRPQSSTLRVLDASRGRVDGKRVTSVVASEDVLVTPHSASLEGSRVIPVDGVGHHGVLFDRRAWQVVEDLLTTARP